MPSRRGTKKYQSVRRVVSAFRGVDLADIRQIAQSKDPDFIRAKLNKPNLSDASALAQARLANQYINLVMAPTSSEVKHAKRMGYALDSRDPTHNANVLGNLKPRRKPTKKAPAQSPKPAKVPAPEIEEELEFEYEEGPEEEEWEFEETEGEAPETGVYDTSGMHPRLMEDWELVFDIKPSSRYPAEQMKEIQAVAERLVRRYRRIGMKQYRLFVKIFYDDGSEPEWISTPVTPTYDLQPIRELDIYLVPLPPPYPPGGLYYPKQHGQTREIERVEGRLVLR